MMSDDSSQHHSKLSEDSKDVAALPAITWMRRASKQVESAGAAIKKIGMKVTLANRLTKTKKKKVDNGEDVSRFFTFDPNAIQRGAELTDLFEHDEIEEDFSEIVDLDDERVEEVVSQELVGRLVDSFWFRGMILGVIIFNAILIGVQTNKDLSQQYAWLFFAFDHTVLSIFVAELCLKWYNGFTIYWKVGWNILDFFIIIILLLGPALTFLGSSRILRILRVLRAFRGLRSVSALTGLSVVIQTVFQSIPDMTNIALLLVIIMVVLSVVGVLLFGDDFPGNFGDLPAAMFSLFICVTQDGWVDLFDSLKNTPHHYIGAVYFIVAIVVGAFVFANLMVAVVVTNLDKAMSEVKEENKMREDVLGSKGDGGDDEGELNKEVPITSVDFVIDKTNFTAQKPLYFGDFNNMTTEKLQNYLIILAALEENLAEYLTIKNDLEKIFHIVWELNEAEQKTELESQGDLTAPQSAAPQIDLKRIGKKGDILSNLLEMEQHKMISTRKGSLTGLIKDAARMVSGNKGTGRQHSRKKSKTDLESLAANGSGTKIGTSIKSGSGTSIGSGTRLNPETVPSSMNRITRSPDRLTPVDRPVSPHPPSTGRAEQERRRRTVTSPHGVGHSETAPGEERTSVTRITIASPLGSLNADPSDERL